MKTIKVKRIYEPLDKTDGYRILVDRLWPRGITKAAAKVDLWLKDIAPTAELRRWFKHQPEKWSGFKRSYFKELTAKKDLVDIIIKNATKSPVTLLFSAKDVEHNNAVALKEYLISNRNLNLMS